MRTERLRAWGRVERDENSSARGGSAGARRPRGRSHSRRPRTERLRAWGRVEKERRGPGRREGRVRRDWRLAENQTRRWVRLFSMQLYPVRVRVRRETRRWVRLLSVQLYPESVRVRLSRDCGLRPPQQWVITTRASFGVCRCR
jgi:hypothetical protein